MKKRGIAAAIAAFLLITAAACGCASNKTEDHALARLTEYADAIDSSYKNPEKIYALLCENFRQQMSEEDFCSAFKKERSYPYITPLYISSPTVEMSQDNTSGTAVYIQAARITGMTYKVSFIYENGDYYIEDWNSFLDGSYLSKFSNIPYSLDWYYSFDDQK